MEQTPALITPTVPTPKLHSPQPLSLPDHTQLPESDGTFVKNFQEHPQSIILTSSIAPVLAILHPDGHYCIGQDSGIYWQLTEPPERGAEAPDWFYVPNVQPLIEGEYRRSYVLWKEVVAPLIAIEFVSGNGDAERDTTPPSKTAKAGKFWVYEQAIRIPFYAIYDVRKAAVEVYHLVDGCYAPIQPNDRGHYTISPMGVALGIQQDSSIPWLRWWDAAGNLLLTGDERAVAEQEGRLQAEQKAQRSEQKAQRFAERLKALGVNPDEI